jgi:hypothetical protein
MLKGWMALFGDGACSVRLLSVLGALATIAALHFLAKDLIGRKASAIAGAFLALSPASIEYSQQARQYTWTAFAAFVAMWTFWHWVKAASWRTALGFSLSFLAALYLHNFSLYLAPFFAFFGLKSLLAAPVNKPRFIQGASMCALVAAGYLPWIPSLLAQLARSDYLFWVDALWQALGAPGVVGSSLASFWFGLPWTRQAPVPSYELALATLFTISLVFAVGKRSPFLSIAFLGPLLLALGGSAVSKHAHFVPGRVDQILMPVFAMLVGVALAKLPQSRFAKAMASVTILCCGTGLVRLYGLTPLIGATEAARSLTEIADAGDHVLFVGLMRGPIEYYLDRESGIKNAESTNLPEIALHSFPRLQELHLGNIAMSKLLDDPGATRAEALSIATEIASRMTTNQKLLLVQSTLKGQPLNRVIVTALAQTRRFDPIKRLGPFGLNRSPGASVLIYQVTRPLHFRQ